MFDAVTYEELRRMARSVSGHQVSIFLPTHTMGSAQAQDPIRLRQLIGRARQQLVELGMRGPDADAFLMPLTRLVDDVAFWSTTESGLALFLDAERLRHFRLGYPIEARCVVADRPQLRTLLPAIRASRPFWILALSQNEVRLLRGDRTTGLTALDLGDVPTSLDAALRFDDRERQLQSHASSRVGSGGVGITMHGQGGVKDTTDEERRRFCQIVDGNLRRAIGDSGDPLVLAGERRLLDSFRSVTTMGGLVARDVVGNPDDLSDRQLGDAGWDVVEEHFDREVLDDTARFGDTVEHRAHSLDASILAAVDGKVDTIIVPIGVRRLGSFDAEERRVQEQPAGTAGVGDLYDFVVAETLRHGGRVHAVDAAAVPGLGPVATTLRY